MKIFLSIFLFCFACTAQVIELPEKQHGSVRVSYGLPAKYNEQTVEFSWLDSNHEAYPAQKVEWYPEEWYIKYHTPIFNAEDSLKPLRWTYKSYRTFRAMAVVTFANGTKIDYPFLVSIQQPNPVLACAADKCDSVLGTK